MSYRNAPFLEVFLYEVLFLLFRYPEIKGEKNMNINEKMRVLEISENTGYIKGVLENVTTYCGDVFKRFMRKGSVLELGPAEGTMTDVLYPCFDDYTIIDGADSFVDAIKKRYPKIKGYSVLFEEYTPSQTYDNIILGHVLEHVENPVEILKLASSWLSSEGQIICAVPNANSIHRQAGVLMGLLETENQLHTGDIRIGHRRVYDMYSLKKDFIDAGLKIIQSGGYWLKPVSIAQIEANWDLNMVNAFLRLGEKYPDIASNIYLVASR